MSKPQFAQTKKRGRPKILAISSRGGHWIQLLRLRPAFQDADVAFASTNADLEPMVNGARFHVVTEATRRQKIKLLMMMLQIMWIILKERPNAIVTTGAAPGLIALCLGKSIGARTLWIDSIANAQQLSLSGRLATKIADQVLTQWEHLADGHHVDFRGAVI